jgi:HK97 gp10 family phage protein
VSVEGDISAALESFHLNEANLEALLTGPDGPVAKQLSRIAIKVEESAKQHATGRPGPNVRTGRLRSSITHRLDKDQQGLYADVGTDVEYGRYLEEGTSRMRPYPFLRPGLEAARGGGES